MDDSCLNCKHRDEYGFCTRLVVDTKRCIVENNKPIKAYYIDIFEDDGRPCFIVPPDFKCKYYEKIEK
jgi:hypothetical protein